MNPIDANNFSAHLAAFADGSLEPAHAAALWSWLEDHPERQGVAIMSLQQIEKLREKVREVVDKNTPATPNTLREKIAQLATNDVSDHPRRAKSSIFEKQWLWLAAAACLVVGISIGLLADSRSPIATHSGANPPQRAVSATIISHASLIHDNCSRLAHGLHGDLFVRRSAALADSVKADLHGDEPYPDLTSLGFVYEGAGPCLAPLENTIHLLYRSDNKRSTATVSLFVQADHGQFTLTADQVYLLSNDTSPFPMLAWRSGGVIYFVIADDRETAQHAFDLMRARER